MRLEDASLAAIRTRITEGSLTARDAVTFFLDRIGQLDSRLQAWTTVDTEGALRQAEQRDAEQRKGRQLGPLHGIPIGIKDIFMTRGLRTTMGSPLFATHVPEIDAEVISLLRDAGAIILGKTVTTQFAALDPSPTRNPWNQDHTPGGSSSGSAAAVAAGLCAAATGSQTAGSVGRPAAFCGVVGLMPTASALSRRGVFPAAWSLDHVGIFARSVDDAGLMLSAMSGESVTKLETELPKRPRVGVIREYFRDNTDPEAWEIHEGFVERLRKESVEVLEPAVPQILRAAPAILRTIMRVEIAAVHSRLHADHPESYGPNLRGMIEAGNVLPAPEYVRALRLRRVYQQEMLRLFDGCDVVISPGARGSAPHGFGSTGDPAACIPWTLADFPTITLPLGLTASRLPIGVQISTPPLSEGRLLSVGRWFENYIEFRERPNLD